MLFRSAPEYGEEARVVLIKLADLLGIHVGVHTYHDHTVIYDDPAWAEQIVRGGSLGEQEAFRSVVPGDGSQTFEAYADLDEILGGTGDGLDALRSAGATSVSEDGVLRLRVELSTD